MTIKKVLVTGGAGFIGSHLVDILLEEGCHVFILDDFSSGNLRNLKRWNSGDDFSDYGDMYKYGYGKRPKHKLIEWDISKPLVRSPWLGSLEEGELDCIFHLAARRDVMTSFKEPYDDTRRNYIGTVNVFELARKIECNKVVLSSSYTIYKDLDQSRIKEDCQKEPISPYGLNKLASEKLLQLYNSHYGMRNVAFRIFVPYGPRQMPKSIFSGVVMRFLDHAMKDEEVTIYGDGEQTRDFIFVKDIARCLHAGFTKDLEGIFNLGTGRETSINKLLEIVRSVTGKELKANYRDSRKGEVRKSVADMTSLMEQIDCGGATSLEEGVRETYKWLTRKKR